jgi:hypothetical protein
VTDGRRSLSRFDSLSIRASLEVVDGRLTIRIDDLHTWEWLELEGDLEAVRQEIDHAQRTPDRNRIQNESLF